MKQLLAVAVVVSLFTNSIHGQADTARADTLRADTLARDTLTAGARVFLPTFPAASLPGPLPWGVRHVFDADSLRFIGALTLGDVLARIPAVFIARGGFYGQAEPAFYGGRGAAGLEIYWDGMPVRPLGRDTLYLDVGRIPLPPLERVEVLRLPDRVRVDLITARVPDTEPRSTIALTTGDLDIADYRAAFARRWASGFGFSLLADFNSLDGAGGSSTEFRSNDIWAQVEFVRPRVGGSYQLLRSGWERQPAANLTDRWKTARYDHLFRAFVASRTDGLGWRVVGLASLSGVSQDSALARPDRMRAASLDISHRWTRAAVGLTGRLTDDDRPREPEVEAHAGWLVLPWLDLAGSARYTDYATGRTGSRLGAAAGVRLPLGLSARLELVSTAQVSARRVAADPLRRTTDWLGAVRWDTRWFNVEVGRTERDAFHPAGAPQGLRPVALLGPTPRTSEITVQGAIRPLPGLSLSATYADPIQGGGDFQPPHHARYAATFFSKFWRVYRSGVFALRAEVAAESWSRGLGGFARDSLGNTSQQFLPGGTFMDLQLEIQIVGVTIFWQMRNANAMPTGYVSGLDYPTVVQFYGARWTFLN